MNDINDVKYISGPVSFYYLKPKELYNDIDLPLLILFGDTHGSFDNMCEDCNNDNGCYRIYDKNFLELLNKLSSSTYPIDFYVETFGDYSYKKLHYPSIPENRPITGPLLKLIDVTEICFKKELRGTVEYSLKCDADNIRWHYGDPRAKFISIEGQMDILLNYFNFLFLQSIDLSVENFLSKIKEESLIKIKKILKLFFEGDSSYLDIIFDDSLMKKQILKNIKYNDIDLWKKIFDSTLEKRILDSEYISLDIINVDIMNNIIDKIENPQYLFKYLKENVENMFQFTQLKIILTRITSTFLDIYFITRFLKGDINDQPSVVISYLGKDHIKYIIYILTDIMKIYNISHKIDDEKNNRCLFIGGITESVDFKNDIKIHNANRNKKPSLSFRSISTKNTGKSKSKANKSKNKKT